MSFIQTRAGTPLGDPIEAGALRKSAAPATTAPSKAASDEQAGQQQARAPPPLALSAVKVLTGHLEGTAGLAGLLQVRADLGARPYRAVAESACRQNWAWRRVPNRRSDVQCDMPRHQ
eukprot:359418-Chlamydomonas_euryale.AAC.1